MTTMGGMTGKLLRVDLSSQDIRTEPLDPQFVADYLGARGLGALYLYKEVGPGVEALAPDNKLIFFNGPMACSLMPGANKVNVTFKSPLTNTYSFSLCGGHWGPELKFAGYDGLIIEGRSEKPVYLWIDDDEIHLKPADKAWGKSVNEADALIREELGGDAGIQIAAIGPAGENLNRMACITAGVFREFGRGGCGAVMGAKNLKAIALRGTRDVSFADTKGLSSLAERLYKVLKDHPKARERRNFGTPEMVKGINDLGLWCTRNFSEGHFAEGFKLEGPEMRKSIVVGDASCYGCPVGCGKRSYVTSDKFGNVLIEGPEFETIGLLGANCGISDWAAIVKATKVCDAYGFDTINAGGCVALAMECFEKGIIGLEDTGGIDLRFGNGDALVKVLELMGENQGIGATLSQGIRAAAEAFGAPELGMHSKGQGFAVYDPRGCKGMALTYATSPKGAHHMMATTMGPEIASGNRLSIENKGALEREQQFSMCAVDALGLCATMRVGVSLGDQAEAFRLITGIAMDEAGLKRAAERIVNLERMYNARMGLTRKDDTLPKRFLKEPMPKGQSAGETVDLDTMLDEYYAVMGWDPNGIPTPAKLAELNLDELCV